MHKRLLLAGLAFLLAAPGAAGAQARHRLVVEDYLRLIDAGTPFISPDGRWVLYTQSRQSLEENRRLTTAWLKSTADSGRGRELLRRGDRFITWAPDSKSVFFFRRTNAADDASDELFQLSLDDSLPRQRSHLGPGDLGYNWQLSSAGGFFLLVRAETKASGPDSALGVVFVDEGANGQVRDSWSNLWRLDLATGDLSRVTEQAWAIGSADLSPDGRMAVVAARPDNGRNTAWKSELYSVDLASGTTRQLTRNVAPERDPRWFPDGRSVLFTAVRLDRWEYGNGDLWVLDVASLQSRNITPGHTGRFGQPTISPGGETILVQSGYGTTRFPVMIDVRSGRITALMSTTGVAAVGSWSADGRSFAYRFQDGITPADVYVGSVSDRGERQRRMSNLNPWVQEEAALGRVELVRWRSAGGLVIEGLLTLPPAGRGPFPLIVYVPCGPGCGWTNQFSLKNQVYAGLGYAQLSVAVRGSSNYDDAFMHQNRFDLGGGDRLDLLSGVDAMIARGIAHADSLAIGGWSYGGVLGAYTLTTTPRFRAASLGAMVGDWMADFGASVHYDLVRWYLGGTPWSEPVKWRERSSITHADKVRTPTLLHSGDQDEVTWPFHALNFFAALRYAGTPARLIRYPGEGHDFQQPRSLKTQLEQEIIWLQRFVRGVRSAGTP